MEQPQLRRAIVPAIAAMAALAAVVAGIWSLIGTPASAGDDERGRVAELFSQTQQAKKVKAGWTGSVKRCKAGRESKASIAATFDTINAIREVAGMPPVRSIAKLNRQALAAALMMHAEGRLSHSPGRGWKCYSKAGANGAAHSNLAGTSGANGVWAYMNEGPDFGHRRWVINPGLLKMGTGSTGKWNALYTISYDEGHRVDDVAADSEVAWPAPGAFPVQWTPKHWSLALGNATTQEDFSAADAEVEVTSDNEPVAVKRIEELDNTYGIGRTIGWEVPALEKESTGHTIDVTITGIELDGQSYGPIEYTVETFDPTAQD